MLKEIRQSKRLTQKAMAELVGVKVRTYASWERQENDMSLSNAIKIADILDVSLDKICNRTKYLDIKKLIKESNLKSLVTNYENLPEENKYQILSLSKSLASINK